MAVGYRKSKDGRLEKKPDLRVQRALEYQKAAASSSCLASGWLTTRIELGPNLPEHFFNRLAHHLTLFDLAGTAVNHIVPLSLRVVR